MVSRDRCDLAMGGLETRLHAKIAIVRADTDQHARDSAGAVLRPECEGKMRELDAKKKGIFSEPGSWIRWAVGLFVLLLGAWWGLSAEFAARPTADWVDTRIDERRPHPDLKVITDQNAKAIQQQQRQLDRIEVGVDAIRDSVKDLKKGR